MGWGGKLRTELRNDVVRYACLISAISGIWHPRIYLRKAITVLRHGIQSHAVARPQTMEARDNIRACNKCGMFSSNLPTGEGEGFVCIGLRKTSYKHTCMQRIQHIVKQRKRLWQCLCPLITCRRYHHFSKCYSMCLPGPASCRILELNNSKAAT